MATSSSSATSENSSEESQDSGFITNTDADAIAPCSTDAGFPRFSATKRLANLDEFYCPLCDSKDKYLEDVLRSHFSGHENGSECLYCKSNTVFKYILTKEGKEHELIYHKCRSKIKDNQEDRNMNEVP